MSVLSKPGSFSHANARIIPLEGVVNFRDIGGYPAAGGRHVRWRRIYRSSQLDRLTDADISILAERRILTIVDLRESDEIAVAPDRAPPGATIIRCPAGKNPVESWSHMLVSATSGVPFMRAIYSDTHSLAARFKPFFETLLNLQDDRALLLHCMAGKDRTGIGIALVMLALGVPHELIMEDYLLTNIHGMKAVNPSVKHLRKNSGSGPALSESVMHDLLAARPEYLDAFFTSLEEHHGSREQFFAQALGLVPEKINLLREKFTE